MQQFSSFCLPKLSSGPDICGSEFVYPAILGAGVIFGEEEWVGDVCGGYKM